MKNKKLVIKPGDNYYFFFFCVCIITVFPWCAGIAAIITHDVWAINTTLIAQAVIICLFVMIRFFYPEKYVIEESYISKYKWKKLIFKIKISDIDKIFIRKNKWYSFFRFCLHFLFQTVPYGDGLTCVSFVFKRCEAIKKVPPGFNSRIFLKPDSYNEHFEFGDVMSLAKCKKLCKKLNIEPTYVK